MFRILDNTIGANRFGPWLIDSHVISMCEDLGSITSIAKKTKLNSKLKNKLHFSPSASVFLSEN